MMRPNLVVGHDHVDKINEEHRLAKSMAESAVEHAIECGRLLLAQKKRLGHGDLQSWVEENCSFGYSTGARYMSAAKQNAKGVAFSSLRELFPSGRTSRRTLSPPEKSKTSAQISTGVEISDAPKSPVVTTAKGREQLAAAKAPAADLSEFVDERDLEAEDREWSERIARVIDADDKLAQMNAELKRAAQEIVALKQARDRYMNEAGAMRRQLTAKDREITRLKRAAA